MGLWLLLLSVTIEDDEEEDQKKVDALGSTNLESSGEQKGATESLHQGQIAKPSKPSKKRIREQGDEPKGIS